MSESADVTPQPRRRLGLRWRKGANTTPGLRQEIHTPNTDQHTKKIEAAVATETPRAAPMKTKANSTSCRRLGLPRQRKELSKKRLEFVVQNEEKTGTEETVQPQASEWRQRQILELEADIETWRKGFKAAVEDLRTLAAPEDTVATLLAQLNIPLEMLKYLDEDC